jgi:hypothetical protein
MALGSIGPSGLTLELHVSPLRQPSPSAGTAQARGADLALLAAEFARKIAAARRHYSGDELAAALAALHNEQRAAETALLVKLAVEARNRRRAMLAALRGTGQGRGGDFRQTLHARSTRPRRPHRRARGQLARHHR